MQIFAKQLLLLAIVVLPGTAIESAKSAPVFGKDVAPILRAHCIQCHRSGGIASIAPFTSYETVRPWAKAIKEMVTLRQMPPWSADPAHSLKFSNDPRLSSEEIASIRGWVDAGGPQGEASGRLDLAADAGEWHGPGNRPPDLVVSMTQEARIPATGDLPYVRLLVQLPLLQDRWIVASQARPGNASVVHHMAITEVEVPAGVSPNDIEGLEAVARATGRTVSVVRPVVTGVSNPNVIDMLGIYTPGSTLETYGGDAGKLLKGGNNRYLNFNIHYTANGKATTDRSQVAFWFRDTPPAHQILRTALAAETILANGKEILTDTPGEKAEGTSVAIPPIPPGSPNYELVSVTAFPRPITLFQLHPHAHFRAKDFRYLAVLPDGRQETLLTVPKYDFRWQMAYELAQPLTLPAGSKVVVTAHYDNSANNRFNPAPEKQVFFRAQNLSSDEMFSPFAQYSEERQRPALPVVQAVGCLATDDNPDTWTLTRSSKPVEVSTQAPNSLTLRKAALTNLAGEAFELIGVSPFSPAEHRGHTVAVKGVLIAGKHNRINVTSLQDIAGACMP